MKQPAFQFYPGDWMKDPAVRSLSLEARGLWIDMLCLMHESDRRGYLQHANGKPVSQDQLARMTGCSPDQISRLLQELFDSGVYSCTTDQGVIFSRRMVRDEIKRQIVEQATRGIGIGRLPLKRGRVEIPQHIRRIVLAVGACAYCGRTTDLTIDHRRPWSWGGTNEIANLQCLCGPCNTAKSDKWEDPKIA